MENRKRSNTAFGIVFIVLIIITMVLMGTVTYFAFSSIKNAERYSAEMPLVTAPPAVPGATLKPTNTPSPETPVVTPVPIETPVIRDDDRIVPELDGNMNGIQFSAENPIPDIFDSVSQSVVGVLNYKTQTFGNQSLIDVYVTGTGFVISSSGYILTNAHVISDAEYVSVMFDTGEEHFVKVIGFDEETDVAVLKLDDVPVKPVTIGNSDEVRVGEYVLAIGNPIDNERYANTLTFGIVSATKRLVTIDNRTNSYIQTDAAINYGNSGGPLLNFKGEVIGINSAKSVYAGFDSYGNTVSAEGIGFAIPINQAIEVMKQLVEHKSVDRPGIGITVSTLTESGAAEYGLKPGVTVISVIVGGPAESAGLQPGDRIISADGVEYTDHLVLVEYIAGLGIGDKVEFLVEREGKEYNITVTLGNKTEMDFSRERSIQPIQK